MTRSALRALFVLYVAATALHVGWILAHEPFVFDAWNVAVTTHAKPFSASNFFEFWWHEYTHSNPRIGQPLAYLSYKLEYFAPIASALAYLAVALGTFVLGTGRWPRWRRGRDLALVASAIGVAWFALPEVGKTLFNRAYGANYFYAAAIQLWFLVPLRLCRTDRVAPGWLVAYALAGVVAGMANEHTGATLCAFLVGYAVWLERRRAVRPVLVWAGAIGAVAGFAVIFFAPGQGERYDGLAQRMTLVGRLLQRGISGNLEIIGDLAVAAAPLLALIAVVLLAGRSGTTADATGAAEPPSDRDARTLIGLALAASVAIAVTLFVSPKLGSRFFLFPMMLVLAGFIGLVDAVVVSPRRLAPLVALAVAASAYAAARTVPLYARVARAGEARIAALAAAPIGSAFTAEAFEQVEPSWWFLGDDMRDVRKRELVAGYFALSRVVFRTFDRDIPLGVSDVRLRTRCEPATAPCLDVADWWEAGAYRGNDLTAVRSRLALGIERLSRAAPGAVDELEVTVEFAGQRPELPRPRLLLARWRRGALRAYAGSIVRAGRSTTRDLQLPAELRDESAEIYLYEVGGTVRKLGTTREPALHYVPSKNGVAWALACDAQECFVVAVTKVGR